MAITSNLSHRLHETLGEEAAHEMVDWMNRVDVRRSELRELNELNFSRIEARFATADARFAAVETRLDGVEARLERVETRLDGVETRLERVREEMRAGFTRLEVRIEQRTADIMKWSFAFWVGSVLTITGALVALGRFLP